MLWESCLPKTDVSHVSWTISSIKIEPTSRLPILRFSGFRCYRIRIWIQGTPCSRPCYCSLSSAWTVFSWFPRSRGCNFICKIIHGQCVMHCKLGLGSWNLFKPFIHVINLTVCFLLINLTVLFYRKNKWHNCSVFYNYFRFLTYNSTVLFLFV